MSKKKKKKPVFDKIGLVFRSPVRAEILKELSEEPQRPISLAENIGIEKQNLNYHLNALKKGGMIQTRRAEFTEEDLPKGKGTKINGISESGKIQVVDGVELTKNGKNMVNQFIDPLYEEEENEKLEKEDD